MESQQPRPESIGGKGFIYTLTFGSITTVINQSRGARPTPGERVSGNLQYMDLCCWNAIIGRLARSARPAINSGQEDARVLLSCPAPPTLSNVCAATLSMVQLPEIATWLPCRRYHTCHFTWQAVHCICLYQAQVIRTKSKLWSKLRMCGINIWAWLMRVPLLRSRLRKLSSHLQNH